MKRVLLFLWSLLLYSCALPSIIILQDLLTAEERVDLGYIYEKQGKILLVEKEYKKAIAKNKKL